MQNKSKSFFDATWITPALGFSSLLIVVLTFVFTFTAQPDVQQGFLTRILPIHVPASWLAYLSFGMTAIYGLAYLITRRNHFDRLSASSAEIGVVFIVLSLFTGALWGRPTWGTYWQWDARMTTTLLMFMVYVGMLMVRGIIDDPARRARVSAVIGVVASVGVPINYMSVYWWNTLHQTPSLSIVEKHSALSNSGILIAFLLSLLGFTVLYIYLLRLRGQIALRVSNLESEEIEMQLGNMKVAQ
jgi:heme exporter protein C